MGKRSSSSNSHLVTARATLLSILSRSAALSSAVSTPSQRLASLRTKIPHSSTSLRPALADPEALRAFPARLRRAISPAAAILRVFDAVHGLERSISSADPASDLPAFLQLLRRLDEALRFLADNCAVNGVAVRWLDDIVDYAEDRSVVDRSYASRLRDLLTSVKNSPESESLDAGLLDASLDILQSEFQRLLARHSVPLLSPRAEPPPPPPPPASASSSSSSSQAIASSLLPLHVVQNLISILDRMNTDDRIDFCVRVYVRVRGPNVRASLEELGMEYLQLDVSKEECRNVERIDKYIVLWGRHLEFAVKHLLEVEYKLCRDVFGKFGSTDLWTGCFAEIAAQAGMLRMIDFGRTVVVSETNEGGPIKLLRLLDMFALMNDLRLDFNRLFSGKVCHDIQDATRDLVKRIVDGACEIFWEILVQVELQRQKPPPAGGAVPKLLTFVLDFCERLLGDQYRPLLTRVLVINSSWKREKFHDSILTDYIFNVINALEHNLEAWSKFYKDTALSSVFMMNVHCHFCSQLRWTKLGELMGHSWLREHEQCKDYYTAIYLRETWGKLPSLLSREGLILFSGGRATARDLVKKRLKAFNIEFEGMHSRQSRWVIPNDALREKTCQLAIQTIVPVYRSYMQNYGLLIEHDAGGTKYVKYTVEELENKLGSLFRYGIGSSGDSEVVVLRHQDHTTPTSV